MTATALEFADAAESMLGAPFQHLGRTAAGLDCIGIPFAAAEICGIRVAPFRDYRRTPRESVLLEQVEARCDQEPWFHYADPGRLIVMRQRVSGCARHFAVSLREKNWAIHMTTEGAKRQRLDLARELIHSVWLLRGIID